MKFATLLTLSSVHMSRTPFPNIQHWAQLGLKEIKFNLHYGEVPGDVLPASHGTYTSCSVIK